MPVRSSNLEILLPVLRNAEAATPSPSNDGTLQPAHAKDDSQDAAEDHATREPDPLHATHDRGRKQCICRCSREESEHGGDGHAHSSSAIAREEQHTTDDDIELVADADADSYATAGSRDSSPSASSSARPRRRPPPVVPPLSALRTTSDDRMSINPAHEVAGVLRSPDSISLASNSTRTSAHQTPATRSRTNTGSGIEDDADTLPAVAAAQIVYGMAANNNMDGALPENDGMHSLRRKLQEIKLLAVSTEEKAKMMHHLMTLEYHARKLEGSLLTPSTNLEKAGGEESVDSASPLLPAAVMPIDPENPFNLRPGDLEPVFSPLPKAPRDVDGDMDEAMDDDLPDLGCMHYKRNVKVQCFDCQRWFPCRHCHDQAKDLPFQHSLNRKMTQNMLCMLCQTPQPAAEVCVTCGEYAAWYYCPKCKLWDNDSNKGIYHCDDCGICRIGEGLGKDFVHCKRCNVCITISWADSHPCIERATEGNCPLCLVALFESRTPVVSLRCGHYMHGECYKELMGVTYKCPVCSKSAVNMEIEWRKLDEAIAQQPMPDDESIEGLLPHVQGTPEPESLNQDATDSPQQNRPRQVWIGCNDCGSRTWTAFHWLGLKCQRCDSYNTIQMAPTAHHETEAERLLRQQQQETHRQHDFTGNDVLRNAGIGVEDTEQYANSALEVPSSTSSAAATNMLPTPGSPSSHLSSSPRLASGAQSPGRYFVRDEDLEPRRPSFTTSRFSAPSMPNLPTLSTLADMPRMPRMPNLPNLPNLQNMRQNLPNMPGMPNVELPRFSGAYEMIDAFSRSLSPMRYYLRGLDSQEDYNEYGSVGIGVNGGGLMGRQRRPVSVRSDPTMRAGSKLRSMSDASGMGAESQSEGMDLFESDAVEDDEDEEGEGSSGESSGDDEDTEMVDGVEEEEEDFAGDFEIFGHR